MQMANPQAAPGWGDPSYGAFQQPRGPQTPYPAYGYGVQSGLRGINTMAVASLIFAVVVWPLGVIFGHVARSQIRRTGEGGDGLALAGLIISYVWGAVLLVIIIAAVTSSSSSSTNSHGMGAQGAPHATAVAACAPLLHA